MATGNLAVQPVTVTPSKPVSSSMPRAPSAGAKGGPDLPDAVGLTYEVNQDTGKVIIKIVDQITKEVIREIPPEEMQQLEAALREMVGARVDRTG